MEKVLEYGWRVEGEAWNGGCFGLYFFRRARGEMADALDSGSSGATRGGSNPLERTKEAREFHLPEAICDWRRVRFQGAQILSSARSKRECPTHAEH